MLGRVRSPRNQALLYALGTTPHSRTHDGAFTTQARVPGSDSFLLNDYTLLWEEAAAASQ